MTNINDFPPLISFHEWFARIMSQKIKQEAKLVGVCAWQIWSARNELIFNKIYVPPDLCFKRAADMLMEYRKANETDHMAPSKRDKARWLPPNPGFLKINVDAGVSLKDDRFGLGLVARNHEGEVILTAAKSVWSFSTVERAKLQAFEWAAELVKEHNWSHVVLEGDAQVAVNALNGKIQRGFILKWWSLTFKLLSRTFPRLPLVFAFVRPIM